MSLHCVKAGKPLVSPHSCTTPDGIKISYLDAATGFEDQSFWVCWTCKTLWRVGQNKYGDLRWYECSRLRTLLYRIFGKVI
jgi:hypothetical protein